MVDFNWVYSVIYKRIKRNCSFLFFKSIHNKSKKKVGKISEERIGHPETNSSHIKLGGRTGS